MPEAIDVAGALARSYLFEQLPAGELADLARQVTVQRVAAGESFWTAGDRADELWVVVAGEVKDSTVDVEGRELIGFLHGPGMTVGEPGFFAPERERMVGMIAIEPSVLIRVDRKVVEPYLARHPEVKDRIIQKMAQVWRLYASTFNSLALRPLVDRIAMRLLELVDAEPRRHDGVGVTPRISQTTLAAMVGVSREHANRALGLLTAAGSVRREGGRYFVLGEVELRARLAANLPLLPFPERRAP